MSPKPPIEPKALKPRYRRITLYDALVLAMNVLEGAGEKDVGYADANKTMDQLLARLAKRKIWIEEGELESCLWSCNLRDEHGRFWHPRGHKFDTFLNDMLPPMVRFNKTYNYLEEK